MSLNWQFWIDVGGTFTDCIGRDRAGLLHTRKVLSSGKTPGRIDEILSANSFRDKRRQGDPTNFWRGYRLQIGDGNESALVTRFDASTGEFDLDRAVLDGCRPGEAYELSSDEPAPVVAIRHILGIELESVIPPLEIRLGTTRGTNSLLTRRGAATAFVTTAGFADVLRIAFQDRPRLFDLDIRKPEPLYQAVVEIEERIAASGEVLQAPKAEQVRRQLKRLKAQGITAVAICLLHAFRNPAHECLVEQVAREIGFDDVSVSHQVVPRIGVVARGDTTVVNAYLNPVLQGYVRQLVDSLPGSDLKLMTSAGGLVAGRHFVGKDSILSGPAGGVVGFSHVAREAGYSRAIGFDMGGTSTDVARYDGRFEYEFETEKAGVRIAAPMLAIETVAAGGGSICRFDGVKLTVGPESAGAEPGPACYGRGGPLTITDMNVFLGRIPADRFPIPLDRDAVICRLEAVARELSEQDEALSLSLEEIAEGFLRIANANMVRAISKISVAKGYDPRDYVLVTFGGAGGQHACAVARSLGIADVLIHPLAGILSAYGIGMADVRRFAEQPLLVPFSQLTADDLEQTFGRLEQQAKREVLEQGVEQSSLEAPIRSLEMRYAGTESTITVTGSGENDSGRVDFAAEFARLHRQWYGFDRPGRDVEVVTARVEVVGRGARVPADQMTVEPREAVPSGRTRGYFSGKWQEVPLFERCELSSGHFFSGPAIVCEGTSTTVIEEGFRGELAARGELIVRGGRVLQEEAISADADPVTLEVFHNLFASIAEQMGAALERTAVSVNVKERRDFSCAVFTAAGDLVANAPHIPVHLGAMSETVQCLLADNPQMRPGDVYVTNDPLRGGSHLPDVTVVTPVFDDATGRRIFFVASRAHHAEIGGIVPGSMPPFSRNLAEEGVLIRNFKLFAEGSSRESDLRNLLVGGPYPTRAVEDNLADITAQVAANQRGVGLLGELCRRHTTDVTLRYMDHVRLAAEKKMRMALAAVADGTYRFVDHLDNGAPICVAVEIRGDEATVDFAGTGDVLPDNLNANRGIVTAALLYVFRCMIREQIPLNSGVLAPITLRLPTCLLNPPYVEDPCACPAVVGGNVETSSRVVDVLLGALDLAAASQGTMNNVTFGDAGFGYYETIGGGSGATGSSAGADAVHTHMTNTRLTDVEVIEHRYPVRLVEFRIRRGAGGGGLHRGGDGMVRTFEFLSPLKVSLLTSRRGPYRPFGLHGGDAGRLGENLWRRAGDLEVRRLPSGVTLDAEVGDRLTILTPGGGGWGTADESRKEQES